MPSQCLIRKILDFKWFG